MITILIALLLANPQLTAVWTGPGSATIQWEQAARGCLYRVPSEGSAVFVGCYDGAGQVNVSLGATGGTDAAYRPRAGDVYLVQIDGQRYRAPLLMRDVRLAVVWG